jgi:membrane associated rhomboid family serine protease
MPELGPILFLVFVAIGGIVGLLWQGLAGAIGGVIVGAVLGAIVLRLGEEAGL